MVFASSGCGTDDHYGEIVGRFLVSIVDNWYAIGNVASVGGIICYDDVTKLAVLGPERCFPMSFQFQVHFIFTC